MIDKTKIKVLNKLFDNAYTTEKKICSDSENMGNN